MTIYFRVLDSTTQKPQLKPLSYTREIPTGTVNGSNLNFVLSLTPFSDDTTDVYLDRLYVVPSEYTLNIGTKTISFVQAPQSSQEVFVKYLKS
jgi:hypothetical protein